MLCVFLSTRAVSVITILLSVTSSSSATDLLCLYNTDEYDTVGFVYSCTVQVSLGIRSPNASIERIIGNHKDGNDDDKVLGLTARDKGMQFMPENLADKFENLVALRVRLGRVQEVHKRDFERWPKLRYLNMDLNNIEVLEEDLFDGNALLEVIWFEGNRIKSVDGGVFDSLSKLKDLDLNSNACVSSRVSTKYDMPAFLKAIKSECYNSDEKVSNLKRKIDRLEGRVKELNGQTRELRELLGKRTVENSELREQLKGGEKKLTEVKNENSKIKNQLSELGGEVLGKNHEIQEKLSEIEVLKMSLKDERDKSENLEEKINKLDEIFAVSQDEVKSLQLKVENFSLETTKLRDQNSKLEAKVEAQDHTIIDLNSQVFSHIEKGSQSEISIQNFTSTIEQLNAVNRDLTANLHAAMRNNTRLQTNVDVLAHKLKILTQLTSSIEMINDTNEELRAENAMLESRVSESEATTGFVLFLIAPIVALMTLINAFVAVKCYAKKRETKYEIKSEKLRMHRVSDSDEIYR